MNVTIENAVMNSLLHLQVRSITTIQNKSARQLMPNSKEADINC